MPYLFVEHNTVMPYEWYLHFWGRDVSNGEIYKKIPELNNQSHHWFESHEEVKAMKQRIADACIAHDLVVVTATEGGRHTRLRTVFKLSVSTKKGPMSLYMDFGYGSEEYHSDFMVMEGSFGTPSNILNYLQRTGVPAIDLDLDNDGEVLDYDVFYVSTTVTPEQQKALLLQGLEVQLLNVESANYHNGGIGVYAGLWLEVESWLDPDVKEDMEECVGEVPPYPVINHHLVTAGKYRRTMSWRSSNIEHFPWAVGKGNFLTGSTNSALLQSGDMDNTDTLGDLVVSEIIAEVDGVIRQFPVKLQRDTDNQKTYHADAEGMSGLWLTLSYASATGAYVTAQQAQVLGFFVHGHRANNNRY